MRKKIISVLFSTVLLGSSIPTAFADQQATDISVYYAPMHYKFDDKEMSPIQDQQGFIYNDSTYVPLRFISYALNQAVRWDQNTYTVTITAPSSQERVEIGEYNLNRAVYDGATQKVDSSQLQADTIPVYFGKVNYIFNGESKQPSEDLQGLIYNDSLFVPMRFFSESLGKQIKWDQETYTVSASTSTTPAPNGEEGQKPGSGTTGNTGAAPSGGVPNVPVTGVPSSGTNSGTKPSYDSIKSESDTQFSNLQLEAQNYFIGLYLQYKKEPVQDQATKARYAAQGSTALAGYDSRFDQILSSAKAKLIANGYGTEIIDQYRSEYEKQKEFAKASIGIK